MVKYLIFFLSFVIIEGCETKSGSDLARQTVQDAFRLSSEKKYDSLSYILNSSWLESDTDSLKYIKSDLNIAFKDMRLAVKTNGLPRKNDLIGREIRSNRGSEYVITYYPKQASELVDSIRFYFQPDYFGFGQIAIYQPYISQKLIENIRTIGVPSDTILKK